MVDAENAKRKDMRRLEEKLQSELEGPRQQVIYIYLLTFILMTYLKDLMRIYFLNFHFLLQMLRWELPLKFQLLMEAKLK